MIPRYQPRKHTATDFYPSSFPPLWDCRCEQSLHCKISFEFFSGFEKPWSDRAVASLRASPAVKSRHLATASKVGRETSVYGGAIQESGVSLPDTSMRTRLVRLRRSFAFGLKHIVQNNPQVKQSVRCLRSRMKPMLGAKYVKGEAQNN